MGIYTKKCYTVKDFYYKIKAYFDICKFYLRMKVNEKLRKLREGKLN